MNRDVLLRKLESVKTQENCCSDTVDRIGEILLSSDDWGLYRMNPYKFAEEHGLTVDAATEVLLRLTRAGILDLSWNLICPFCGGVQHSYDSLGAIEGDSFYCKVCHMEFPIHLDEFIEVSFTVNPEIHVLDLKPFESRSNYIKTYFSKNYSFSAAMSEYFKDKFLAFVVFHPRSVETIKLDAKPDMSYRIVSIMNLSDIVFKVAGDYEGGNSPVDIRVSMSGFEPETVVISPGENLIRVENVSDSTVAGFVQIVDFEKLHRSVLVDPPTLSTFLTGKSLLSSQTFRDLFRIQDFITNLRVNVRSLTLLFTDLKGSTEMYENIGDVAAYRLVQDHFELLGEAIRRNRGSIVKTMGDAVMATFSEPADGLAASVDMLKSMDGFHIKNLPQLGLKIGLHEGPALAIDNEGKLDYFGQTVNIAARVQGLASAGEIWITENFYDACNAGIALGSAGYETEKRLVTLKGVGGEVGVYRCRLPESA